MTISLKSEWSAFGEEVARLRTRKGWSRSMLVNRLYLVLGKEGLFDHNCSEAWLNRLENGVVVKLPRPIVNAVCTALECTHEEQARLLLLADRNVLLEVPCQLSDELELFNYMMIDLYQETSQLLTLMVGQRQITKLSYAERSELFYTALEMVITNRRAKASSQEQGNGR